MQGVICSTALSFTLLCYPLCITADKTIHNFFNLHCRDIVAEPLKKWLQQPNKEFSLLVISTIIRANCIRRETQRRTIKGLFVQKCGRS